jgi:hypothetical protein
LLLVPCGRPQTRRCGNKPNLRPAQMFPNLLSGRVRRALPGGGGQLHSHLPSETGEPIVPRQLLQALFTGIAGYAGLLSFMTV